MIWLVRAGRKSPTVCRELGLRTTLPLYQGLYDKPGLGFAVLVPASFSASTSTSSSASTSPSTSTYTYTHTYDDYYYYCYYYCYC